MPPDFKHSQPIAVPEWTNYSGSIGKHQIPIFCTIPGNPSQPGALSRHAAAVREILAYCFAEPQPAKLRTIGSTWSFSKVIEPGQVVIDPGNMCYVSGIPKRLWTDAYKARAAQGFTPIFAEGGTGIGTLNEVLGGSRLALQTSGAGNGHRIAGCIATGTHGSALRIGALHDTVLAMVLLVGPDQMLFVQGGSNPPFLPGAAAWIEEQTGVPTRMVADDAAIAAARVALGSIGFVFGVVVEATELYQLRIKRLKRSVGDPLVRNAIRTLETAALQPSNATDRPYHFEVVMHPYPYPPPGKRSWFVTMMWKRSAEGRPFASPLQGIPRTTVDTMGLIGSLTDIFGRGPLGPLTLNLVRDKIFEQLDGDAKPEDDALFPGQVFGPTTLPRGHGASTEIAVDQQQAEAALDAVQDVLAAQAAPDKGNYLLGCVAVRFVPKTRALLGMNQADMTCFIELPSIRNDDVLAIYRALWAELDRRQISFACHWGQMGGFTPERVQRYYGQNVELWKQQRRKLLASDAAMQVFASKLLHEAGLDG